MSATLLAGTRPATSSPPRPQGAAPRTSGAAPSGAPRPAPRLVALPDAVRRTLALFGASGSGKSLAIGKILAWQDFVRGYPVVLFDPKGQTVDYFLCKIASRPPEEREVLGSRVRYVNMNGQDGRVVPFPVYAPAGPTDRFDTVATRFIDVAIRADPKLREAPMQGENAFVENGTAVGIVLCALGLGISEAWSLVSEPAQWESRLQLVETAYPQTREAVRTIRALHRLRSHDQRSEVSSLRAKLALFRFLPTFKAIFGAGAPGVNWQTVVNEGQAVLLDFGQIPHAKAKKFAYLWVYESFLAFVKQRGYGQHLPISLIIDEVSDLVSNAGVDQDILSGQLNELISILARSHQLWVTIAGQELSQLPEAQLKTVLSASALMIGRTSDPEMAERLAGRFFRYDPHKVKKVEPVYGVVADAQPGGFRLPAEPARHGITHWRTTEYTREEQNYFKSLDFMELAPGQFLLGRGSREGELPTTLEKITITQVDPGLYAENALAARIRAKLTARDAVAEEEVLSEIASRTAQCPCLRRPVFHDLVHGHPPSAHAAPDGASSSATASPPGPRRSPPTSRSSDARRAQPTGRGRARAPGAEPDMVRAGIDRRPGH